MSGQSVSDTEHSRNPGTLLFLAREIQAPVSQWVKRLYPKFLSSLGSLARSM